MTQFVVRVPDGVAAEVDRLVERGTAGSRSELVRQGLEIVLDQHRRRAVAEEIVRGYRETPQVDDGSWPDSATAAMIADEPW